MSHADTSPAARYYRQVLKARDPETFAKLARIKRFMERLCGDLQFRLDLAAHPYDPQVVIDPLGLDLDAESLRPLYDLRYCKHRRKLDELEPWPLARLWDAWLADMIGHRDVIAATGKDLETNPAYSGWRARQMRRVKSEIGRASDGIVHASMAVELSEGCTVGCWFCGISAERFKGYLPYTPENATLWKEVLVAYRDVFGQASQSGFCYWATDPSDNPDYPRYLRDFHDIIGHLPQTTTAAALKNLDLTREILAMEREMGSVVNRFSVLSKKQLDQIHATFTPDELMMVELVQQQKESLNGISDTGRAHERKVRLEEAGKMAEVAKENFQIGTIACVSGLLLQMVPKRVQLVTPTRMSTRWPKGYRVVAEADFEDAASFRAAIEGFRDHHMRQQIYAQDRVAIRWDLEPAIEGDQLVFRNEMTTQSLDLVDGLREIAPEVVEGRHTVAELLQAAIQRGANPFEAQAALRMLFDNGLLDEEGWAPAGAAGPAPVRQAALQGAAAE